MTGAGDGPVRPPAVAGAFYPADAGALTDAVDRALDAATAPDPSPPRTRPKALIVPHAGYVYSGAIAASAYARLLPWREQVRRVVVIGPAHRAPVRSMAVSSATGWDTPLGRVPLDEEARARVLALPGVTVDDDAHASEHSIEVELPFLQRVLAAPFTLVPIVVGNAPAAEVAGALDALWDGDETIVVISSDLSHYEDRASAADHDRRTVGHILAGRSDAIGPHDACGASGIRGLLVAARARRLDVDLVDLRNSGDTAGPADRVVGYGSLVFAPSAAAWTHPRQEEPVGEVVMSRSGDGAPRAEPATFSEQDGQVVLTAAIEAIRARLEGREPAPPAAGLGPHLRAPAATFVTLRDGRRLLGCIGSIEARRPLLDDVSDNAVAAAFRDPRMPVLTPFEFSRMSVHVSVLTPPEPLVVPSLERLRDALAPGVDGVLIEAGRKRATFLPSVWRQVPDPADFLAQLWRKAGLEQRAWPNRLRVWRYRVVELADDGPRASPRARAVASTPKVD